MGLSFYICPLCGQEFKWAGRKKTVQCGDHTLQVSENKGVMTVQVQTKPKENVLKVTK